MNYLRSNSIEIRIANDRYSLVISGYLPTNQLSHALYDKNRKEFFREKIQKGAFEKAINDTIPRLLLNHNSEKELKIIKFNSYEDDNGLNFNVEIQPNEELIEAIDSDSITGLSFGFKAGERQTWQRVNGELIRTIYKFKSLDEISILFGEGNLPAYPQTSVLVGESRKCIIDQEIKNLKETLSKLRYEDMKSTLKSLKGL